MSERLGPGRQSIETGKPEKRKLSDEEMGNLLAAFGNNEAKAITLFAMRGGNIYSRSSLHRALLNLQGINKGWVMGRSLPFGYCQDSLSPIGLVTKEVLDFDLQTWGYQITDYGEKAMSLVGLSLGWSLEHPPFSLYDLLGNTASPSQSEKEIETLEKETAEFKSRSPLRRYKIFLELLTSPQLPIRGTDLAKRIGLLQEAFLTMHLDSLLQTNLITFDSRKGPGNPFTFYRLNKVDDVSPSRTEKVLTQKVYQILRSKPDAWWGIDEITTAILKEQENSAKEDKKNVYYTRVSFVLHNLEKRGFIQRRKFSHFIQSEINLTDPQRELLTSLVEIIDGFQNQKEEVLERGEKYLNYFSSHPEAISQLMQKAKEHSRWASQIPFEESASLILSFLDQNPQSTTSKIRDFLKAEQERRLSLGRIRELLSTLHRQNLVSRTKEEGYLRWSTAGASPAPTRLNHNFSLGKKGFVVI